MSTVALVVRTSRPEARDLAAATVTWLAGEGHATRMLLVDGMDGVTEPDAPRPGGPVDLTGVDLAVTLGGDGTFLSMVQAAWAADVPLLGVNFGRLGYLMEVAPSELRVALELALAGRTPIQERLALAVTVEGGLAEAEDRSGTGSETGEDGVRSWIALNEMVAEKTVPGHTVHLTTIIDGEPFLTYSADGVLVATSTGSTAYNLSAGGPALSPELPALIVTPVAPHLSPDRSLVLAPHQEVAIVVGAGRPAVLVIDGRAVGRLAPGSTVTCRSATRPVRVVSDGQAGFARLLRAALALGPEP